MPDIIIRPAIYDDADAIGRVHALSWHVAYRGIVAQDYMDRHVTPDIRAARWREALSQVEPLKATFVAAAGDAVLGFASAGPSRDEAYAGWGELWSIYLHPHHFGKGAGTALFNASVLHLKASGFDRMFVNVLEKNDGARKFYERMGGRFSKILPDRVVLDGIVYPEIVYAWESLK